MIVSITGRKGHGKNAMADILRDELGFKQTAFAIGVKEACKRVFNLSHEQLHGTQKQKETIDERWGMTPREMMQFMGTEVGRDGNLGFFLPKVPQMVIEETFRQMGLTPGKNIWVNKCFDNIRDGMHPWPDTHWAITDMRFPNEAEASRANEAFRVRVFRPDTDSGSFNEHRSETSIDSLPVELVIHNDGTLEDLRARVLHEMRVLGLGWASKH